MWAENLSSVDFRIRYADFPLTRYLEISWREAENLNDQDMREVKIGAWTSGLSRHSTLLPLTGLCRFP